MLSPGRLRHLAASHCCTRWRITGGCCCCAVSRPSSLAYSPSCGLLLTLLTLTFLWGAYAIVDGVLALWEAIAGRGGYTGSRFWLAIVGIAGIIAGLLAFAWPGLTALVLLMFIAVWAIVTGLFEVWGAIQLRKEIEGEWLLILSGLLSVAFGVILLARPGIGALAVVWLIGWYAILAGGLYVALAFRLKKHKHPA